MHEYCCQHTVNTAASATSLSDRNMLPPPPQANHKAWTSMDTQYSLTDMDIITQEQSEPSIEEEYASYVTMPAYCSANIVNYWEVGSIALSFVTVLFSSAPQTSKLQYPTLFAIAMDYLPIQASAVPCEQAFSSRAETLTAHCNRIKLGLMEALQMLKFAMKKFHLNFMEDLLTSEEVMDENEDDDTSLQRLLDVRSIGVVSGDTRSANIGDQ